MSSLTTTFSAAHRGAINRRSRVTTARAEVQARQGIRRGRAGAARAGTRDQGARYAGHRARNAAGQESIVMSQHQPIPADVRLRTVYERVRHHLLTQGEESALLSNGPRMYHAPNGNRCAIGILIADHAYSAELEFRPVTDPLVVAALEASGVSVDAPILVLLKELQAIHDHDSPDYWAEELERVRP